MDIEILEEREGTTLILVPVGRLDSTNARAFEDVVLDHVNNGEQRVVVDFSRLVFISSSGMRVLLIAAKRLRANAGKLVLCAMQASIHEIFSISGFDKIIPIVATRTAALDAV